ncbi:hypothetical protein Aple_064540 [Acrocarpospora pleiomorpha]|uniref:Uncharacterized protein n=1 Tax=Acrocarpospora pleiomorpha TaxID=90975 RepID=A0A5M3XQF9_9ACTN|nr:hypothetical protein Aple_064540 [Acrocarpospora pleiomorpha]
MSDLGTFEVCVLAMDGTLNMTNSFRVGLAGNPVPRESQAIAELGHPLTGIWERPAMQAVNRSCPHLLGRV